MKIILEHKPDHPDHIKRQERWSDDDAQRIVSECIGFGKSFHLDLQPYPEATVTQLVGCLGKVVFFDPANFKRVEMAEIEFHPALNYFGGCLIALF